MNILQAGKEIDMKRNWNWKLTPMGTLLIFNGKSLYWEYEGCGELNEKEQEQFVKEVIEEYKDILDGNL